MPRRNFIGFEQFIGPAAPKRPPRFLVDIRQPPGPKRLHGVVSGFPDVRGIGQARAVHVGQVAHDLHDVRVLEAFVFELVDRGGVGRGPIRLRRRSPCKREREREQDREFRKLAHSHSPHTWKDSNPGSFLVCCGSRL